MTKRTRVIACAGAAFVTAVVGVFVARLVHAPAPGGDINALVSAVGPNVPFDARLSAPFAPSSRETKRAGEVSPASL